MTEQQYQAIIALLMQNSLATIKIEASINTILELLTEQKVANQNISKEEVQKQIKALILANQIQLAKNNAAIFAKLFPDQQELFNSFLKPRPEDN
jgi:hypothetical protein